MRKFNKLAFLAILLSSIAALAVDEYKIDPNHSSATFAVKHFLVSTVRGRFTQVNGTILLDEADMTKSSVNAVIAASSVNTDNERRDADLRSPRFFEVEKYPEITFKSSKVEKTADGYVATGLLTIKDVSKEIKLPFTLAKGENRGTAVLGIDTSTQINRLDYHVNYDATGTTVGKDVKIEITIEARKNAPAPPAAPTGTAVVPR